MNEILTVELFAHLLANAYDTGNSPRILAHDAALRLALETATRERDEARRTVISRDEWRRHAEEQLADVLELRFLGIEFASQYGDRALTCRYDNSCDDSGREPSCVPCAFRRALGQKEGRRG